jgi:hypothetical protein
MRQYGAGHADRAEDVGLKQSAGLLDGALLGSASDTETGVLTSKSMRPEPSSTSPATDSSSVTLSGRNTTSPRFSPGVARRLVPYTVYLGEQLLDRPYLAGAGRDATTFGVIAGAGTGYAATRAGALSKLDRAPAVADPQGVGPARQLSHAVHDDQPQRSAALERLDPRV